MRWRRFAFWSSFGLLALIALAVSWLFVADLGSFKPQIERWASEATGRDISIDGELRIDLAAQSSLVAEGLRISNADWADEPDMISVGRLELRFDLRSLLNGPILVDLIDLDDASIFLAKPEEGDPNWVMMERPADSPKEPDDEKKKGIHFKQIDVDNVSLIYSAADRPAPVELYVGHITQRHRDDDFLQLSIAGTLNDREIKLDGEVGTWDGLLRQKDVQFDLGGRLGSFTVSANGHIDDLLRPHRPRINFTAAAPDINDVLQALGVQQEGEGDIDLVGALTPEEQGPLVLDVAGAVGRLDIEAIGEFSDLRDLQDIDIKLLATGEDVRPILEALGLEQTKPSPLMINLSAARRGPTFVIEQADMVFGQARFGLSARLPEFPRVDEGVIKLQIDGPDIERFREVFNLPGVATGPFSIGFTVDVADDGLELLNLDLQTSLGKFHADGKLGDAPDFYNSSLNFEIQSDNLSRIATAYGVKRLPEAPIQVRGSADYGPDGIQSRDSLSVTVGEVSIKVDGLIKPVRGLFGSDFEFKLDGPDLAALIGAFAANKGVPEQPYALDGQLQIRDDGYRFREVRGKVGSSDVEIDGLLVPRRRIIGSRFDFTARGAAFTEVIDQLGEFQVRPGPYELSGAVDFEPDLIKFDEIELVRATGKVNFDFELGMPVSRRWANLDIKASGPNVQDLLKTVENFEADEAPFMIDIEGNLRETTWQVDKLDINVGLASLSGQGILDLDDDTSSTNFDLEINVPNVGALGMLNGNRMREQDFTLQADVTGNDDELHVDNLVMTLGDSDIQGDINYRSGDTPRLDVDIESDSVIFAPLLEPRQDDYDPAPEFDDGRLIPDVMVPFDAMAKLNATVEVDVGELQRDTLHMRDIVLRAALQDGALEVSEARFQARSGALAARVRIEPHAGEGKASVEVVAREFALGMTELNRDVAMTGDLDIKLESTGTGLRELAGNVSGVLFLNSRGGRMVSNRLMHALYGNMLDEIIGTINPFSETQEHTDFECVILPVVFDSGVVTSNPNSLIATGKIRLVTKSRINLKTESLDVNIRTTPKRGISFSAGEIINPYIKVVGTLAAPRLAVDETGVLLSGSAAVATGGLSVLARAAWTRMSRAKDPCMETATEGVENLGERFSDLTVTIIKPPIQADPITAEQ